MKTKAFLLAVFAVSVTAQADEPSITKIVMRLVGPAVKANAFAAKPKTLYRAGTKYARSEEQLDVENNIHALIIVNEPDTWMINLADGTARHIVDPGPTFKFHAPVFWVAKRKGEEDPDKAFKELEFGNELQFFRQNAAQDAGARQVDGESCKALVLKKGTRKLTLLIDQRTEKPVQIDIERTGEANVSVRYLEYQTGLPFQRSLFEPPKGLKMTEANQVDAGRYDELAAWAEEDCDDFRALVTQTNNARNAHEVALAMRENVRRQRETIKILLRFARSHPELRDAAQLGLSEQGQVFWHQHYPNRTKLPAEVVAIQQNLSRCLDAVGSKAREQMVAVLAKYLKDPEVSSVSKGLDEIGSESDRKLLNVLR
jgi:hypothetical protein